jgi:hypothetical protein
MKNGFWAARSEGENVKTFHQSLAALLVDTLFVSIFFEPTLFAPNIVFRTIDDPFVAPSRRVGVSTTDDNGIALLAAYRIPALPPSFWFTFSYNLSDMSSAGGP